MGSFNDKTSRRRHLARAFAQWELGHTDWANTFAFILNPDNPDEDAERIVRNAIGDEFDLVMRETR